MPEGHTIHRIASDHEKWFVGQRLAVYSPQGRFEEEAQQLTGKKLVDVTAHGKHLFYHWGRNRIVHVHLGLYGKFRLHKNPAPEPQGAVRLRVMGRERSFDLNGPNCCELIDQEGFREIKERLGQDPLRDDADFEKVWERFRRSRASVGSLLLNQTLIAGVGNVYRAELLFLLKIHPETPAQSLSRERVEQLWDLTVDLLKTGVRYNRIITVERAQTNKPLSRLNSSERLHIYKRSHCPRCEGQVKSWILANRKIYACPVCQPAP